MNKSLPYFVWIIFMGLISFDGIGQKLMTARYEVTPNMLLDIAQKYPSKKENIEQKIHDEIPRFIDFILIDRDLIQCFWGYDQQLINIKIYSNQENKMIYIDHNNEVKFESKPSAFDSLSIHTKDESDSVFTYQINEKGAIPITITVDHPISETDFKYQSNFGQYPEITIVTELLIFPSRYIMGSPKAMLTYELIPNNTLHNIISVEEYLHLLKHIKSKDERLQFIQKLIAKE